MIAGKNTLILVALAAASAVPDVWAAPVGTRNLDVTSLRRMAEHWPAARRAQHSATTAATVNPPDAPVPVFARAGAPETAKQPEEKRAVRRHHTKRELASDTVKPRAILRFQRDAAPSRHTPVDPEVVPRKDDAMNSNVARTDGTAEQLKRAADPGVPAGSSGGNNAEPQAREAPSPPPQVSKRSLEASAVKREETQPGLIKPIAMFRRAFAFEDLD